MVFVRLTGASKEEHNQYKSAAHLLQHITTSVLGGFTKGPVMQALRMLQIDDFPNKNEAPVQHVKNTNNSRNRAKQGAKTGR